MKQNKGFTVLELLVVVAIIASLTTIVLAQLNASREKAMAVQTLSQLEEIEKAMRTYVQIENINEWWEDATPGDPLNADLLEHLINNTPGHGLAYRPDLRDYLPTAPETVSGEAYMYRNDGATAVLPCADPHSAPPSYFFLRGYVGDTEF